ncbi:MAG: ABC transporter permease subunit [Lentisphaeria bacterium]
MYLIFPPELPLAFYLSVVIASILWQRGGWITGLVAGVVLVSITASDALVAGFPQIPPHWYMLLLFVAITYWAVGNGLAVFALVGLFVIEGMALWSQMIQTLGLVFAATFFALLIGIPVGIWASRSDLVERVVRPILDFMQTMPVFVYLIPAVLFFTLGKVPGAMATVIFAMPPAVRMTNLGIRQVSEEVVEAGQAFGSTPTQMLVKVQLPIALPTILAGVNQTIMLALSMVVISAMIGAGGLGQVVLNGITQMEIGTGFEGGLAVVILAMLLDRVTQALGTQKQNK